MAALGLSTVSGGAGRRSVSLAVGAVVVPVAGRSLGWPGSSANMSAITAAPNIVAIMSTVRFRFIP